ncbi:toll/interleukin-1 receptor domain-containing protein [Terrarubrum flagellatum]|uniref:toll/interleukin-1 receptor domain-containing protein n=1 Tax=Terrirubrum flagellatum TaxID=2895980 RepID=UPI0031451A97
MPKVFFSYSHADEALRDQLEKQLAMLKRQGVIETWHDRRIGAGEELDRAIDSQIETAEIILLLISPDFIASEYCYEREMVRAMARHEAGEAIVVPVILRACEWHGAPFGKLMATPPDGKPVTQWPDRDQAMLEIARAVRGAAERFQTKTRSASASQPSAQAEPLPRQPRSSNLRIAKKFTEREKDAFRVDAFDYIAKFFENSISEISARNHDIDGAFRRVDGNRFTAAIYRGGKAVARCTIFMGGSYFGNSICYTAGETTESNSYNESLSVEADDQSPYLRSMGMLSRGRREDERLTFEGAAELYWDMLIEPLQRG